MQSQPLLLQMSVDVDYSHLFCAFEERKRMRVCFSTIFVFVEVYTSSPSPVGVDDRRIALFLIRCLHSFIRSSSSLFDMCSLLSYCLQLTDCLIHHNTIQGPIILSYTKWYQKVGV